MATAPDAQKSPPPPEWLSPVAAGRKILYTPEDATRLSEPLCIVRGQIEAFAATQDDIRARAGRGGMKRESLAVGRVGIRCIHCSHLPLADRARGAVSYPKSAQIMYQAVRNFQRYHFLACEQTPAHVKKRFQDCRGVSSQSKKDAKEYCIICCENMGMVDTGTDGGIRFDPEVSPEDANSVNGGASLSSVPNAAAMSNLAMDDLICCENMGMEDTGTDGEIRFGSEMLSEYVNNSSGGTPLSSARDASAMVSEAMDGLPPRFTAQEEKQELATLSPTEISRAEADLRGITLDLASIDIAERDDEEWRREQLYSLDSELATIPVSEKTAFLEAVTTCPAMVNDEHKIAFLEREGFDVKLAAGRLVRYWKTKLTVFGPEKCFLPLTLRGAMKDEVDGMIKSCPFQVMPEKDTAGRAIIFIDSCRRDCSVYSTKSAIIALWYMVEAATEDPEVRKKGIITLSFVKNAERKHFDPALKGFIRTFWGVSPVACRSIHICHPNFIAYYVLFPIMKRLIGREYRLRLKMHYGTEEVVLSELQSYCLPRDCVPAELGGDLVLDIEKWVNDRLLLENRRDNQGRVLDRVTDFEAGGRAAKRTRNESMQSVRDDDSLASIDLDSSLFQTENHAQLSSGIHATSQPATEACNKFASTVAGTTFQGATNSSSDGIGQERRDSFYDSIMELPGLEDLGTDDVRSVIMDTEPSICPSFLAETKKRRVGENKDE